MTTLTPLKSDWDLEKSGQPKTMMAGRFQECVSPPTNLLF